MEHYREGYRCIVYAYVLISNHVHLLIETGAVGLSKIMQGSSSAIHSAIIAVTVW